MKKIPTIFVRDWTHHGEITTEIHPDCVWVINGEGVPTRKWDGTACLVQQGKLYKRFDRKRNQKKGKQGEWKPEPLGWIETQPPDEKTGHWFGWVPVDFSDPSNQWHKEAWIRSKDLFPDRTYELCGPRMNGNPDNIPEHTLIPHGKEILELPVRSWETIRQYLSDHEIEGIVFHHPDGRMAKIKRRDFGFQWNGSQDS